MKIAAFLDRDGTINQERGYLRQLDELVLISGAAQAVRKLNDAGILAILTTNQTGPARGYYDEAHVMALNSKLETLLKEEADAHLDAVYYSPYLLNGSVPEYSKDSACRKPGIGMIERALEAFPEIDLPHSYVLGDKATDVEFAYNAGCTGILLKTGYGLRVLDGSYQVLEKPPHFVSESIVDAVDLILSQTLHESISSPSKSFPNLTLD